VTPPDNNDDDEPDDKPERDDQGAIESMRVRDVVTRSPSELESALSPDEVAKLAAWFGLPSFTQLADEGKAFDPDELTGGKERREARERALAAVDPAMIDRLERHTAAARRLPRFQAQLAIRLDPSFATREPMEPKVLEPTDVFIPPQLSDDLKEAVPQALLRDLHRLEEDYSLHYERHETALAGLDPVGEVREILGARYRLDRPDTPSASGRRELAKLRELRAAAWSEILTLRAGPNRPHGD